MDLKPALSPELVARAQTTINLSPATVAALEYERSSWANGSVTEESFYTVPENAVDLSPGTFLKVQEDANTSAYTIPPNTALSRIMYQSKALNGALVPVSAYVLWPFSPRSQTDGYQVVGWAHGTIGFTAECAPSHFKDLWQHFLGPYQLALQGYVVVATDYAGLGVGKDALRNTIIHEYLVGPSQANDVFYSIQAAQAAFPVLSKDFVIVGHSQGGGAAWAAAQRQAIEPVLGYLGAVAVSPITKIVDEPGHYGPILGAVISPGMVSAFSDFSYKDILTPNGEQVLEAVLRTGSGTAAATSMLLGVDLLQANWKENSHIQQYQSLIANGGRKIQGPLLVIHGESDPLVSACVTTSAVNKTIELFPSSQLKYVLLPNTTHVPALSGSQRIWMDWIAERFAGQVVETGYQHFVATPARPAASYQQEMNWYIATATEFYETP